MPLLLSAIGLADIGTDVLTENRQLSDVVHLRVPTTDLTSQYNPPSPVASPHCTVATGPDLAMQGRPGLQGSSWAVSGTAIRATTKVTAKGAHSAPMPNVGYGQRPAVRGHRYRCRPGAIRQPGFLLNSKGSSGRCSVARRPAT